MGEKIVVGPFTKGLSNGIEPFYINNDSFPTLINAYTWRGRIQRKRGTSLLCRLQRYFSSTVSSYSSTSTITLNGSGTGNILSGFSLTGNLIPTTITITNGGNNYTDTDGDGILYKAAVASGTVNYASGSVTISAEAGNAVSAVFRYYPVKPVMGLRQFNQPGTSDNYANSIAFDTKYAYNIERTDPFRSYDISFYKNPASSGTYTQKTNITPLTWSGQDYQLFWSCDYENSMWATNGVTVPFLATNIGMQYKTVTNVAPLTATTATITIASHGLVIGDFLFFNEFDTGTVTGLNLQTGYVTAVPTNDTLTVTFPNATIGGAGGATSGIAQYLTNTSDSTKSCLRFYDGDPTNGSVTSPVLNGRKGWVNFCPPISNGDLSIGGLPADQYYLVGSRMILPFKDRLLFIGPVVQTSSSGSQQYLQDTIIYSQNGTPYYTASFTGSAISTSTTFYPLLTPQASTSSQVLGSSPAAFFSDVTGFGGFITAGLDEPIITAVKNQDIIILGFPSTKARLIFTGNDIVPFNFFFINSEFGDSSTFSAIQLDRGVVSKGTLGYIMTTQSDSDRIDLDIPDEVFQTRLSENGNERCCCQRDYIKEWIYFSYPSNTGQGNSSSFKFPAKTLQYNYREQTFGIFNETYTSYGIYNQSTGYTWNTIGDVFNTWTDWNDPWNAGSSTQLQPTVIAGNQQGFVLRRDDGTAEGDSLQITSFSSSTITSENHCLNTGDYIVISGCIGTISSAVNGKIFSVNVLTADTFQLNPPIGSGTYSGGGLIKRMYKPFIQTKQFPVAWGMGRKTRLGTQQYLISATPKGQIQLLIYLNQSGDTPYNQGNITPDLDVQNATLVYNNILYTCPESTNLGLTAANVNLQNMIGNQAQKIWHRMNTSLIGDTVQIGFTMSDSQMRDTDFNNQFAEIEIHGMILDVYPSQMLS